MNLRLLALLILSILYTTLFAASPALADRHRTNIVNVPASRYGAGYKNWGVTTDAEGRVYVANNNGLLEYNGVKWRLYTDAPCAIMRSVVVGKDNRIYTGGFREFGYWERDDNGVLHYTSLSDRITEVEFKDEDIWRICIVGEEVYFQSFSRIYRYNGSEVRVIDPNRFIMFLQEIDGKLYIEQNGTLMTVKEQGLQPLVKLGVNSVKVILPFENGELLLGADSGELFRLKDGKPVVWAPELTKVLKGNDLNCAIRLYSGNYLFGTLGNGVFETDSDGKLLHHYFTGNGLQSNSVNALTQDSRGNVWVAMDAGVAKLEFNSQINYFMDPANELGSVYTARIFAGNLYLGTNKGLFYIPVGELYSANPFGSLKRVAGSLHQVWDLEVFNNELLCGDNMGAFQVENTQTARYIYEGSGVLAMRGIHNNSSVLLATYHTPVLLSRNAAGKFLFDSHLSDFAGVSNTVDVDNLDFIWMGHLYSGLFQNILEPESNRLKRVRYFSSEMFGEKGMPVKVSRLGHRTLFIHDDRFFFYNELSKEIEPFNLLNDLQLPVKRINKIVGVDDHTYWVIGKNSFAILDYVNGNVKVSDIGYFDDKRYSTVDDYENMVPLNDTTSLICLNNGFALYRHDDAVSANNTGDVYVDRVTVSGHNRTHALPLHPKRRVQLKSGENNISFDIASYNNPDWNGYYSYMLEGIDSTWSKPVKLPVLTYERLPKGEYRLRLRSINGEEIKAENTDAGYAFSILPPWYLSKLAICIWMLLAVTGGYLIYRFIRNRHKIELRKQAEKNEELRVREKNSMLEQMVKHKNNELFQITATMLRKNEMMAEVKNEIENFNSKHPDSSIGRKLNRIVRTMNDETIAREDWSLFIMHFEQTHENFFKNVKEAYPSFTPAELKLCACLKLNLATKDIASLLNISVRGVEAGRYRLRKKIEIDPNENLNDFFIRNF
ncbi:MAG: triple tyrosine motif-containing protein [Bacteroidales bacterium]